MLRDGVKERTEGDVFLSDHFTVTKRNLDKHCFVLDLSAPNQFVEAFNFRMLTVSQVRLNLTQGDWLMAKGLKNAYWHIPIHKQIKEFLAFWVGKSTYQFNRLTFDFLLAPRVFAQMTKVLAAKLSGRQVNIMMYLEDWLIASPSREQARCDLQMTISEAQ